MSDAETVEPKKTKPLRQKVVAFCSWFCVTLIVAIWLLIRTACDRWWVATLIGFGPRWTYAAPLAILIPAALFMRRRSLGVLAVGAFVALFPVMDLVIPWRAVVPPASHGTSLRVLTCNTHNNALNTEAFAALVDETNPDLIALQEWSGRSQAIFNKRPWHVRRDGEFCLGSRYPIRKVGNVTYQDSWPAVQYEVQTPGGAVRFFNVHLASPHYAFRAALHAEPQGVGRMEVNRELRLNGARELDDLQAAWSGPVLMAGDFNLPADSTIYQRHLSTLGDAFSQGGAGFGWTYRVRYTVTRIDHVLSNGAWECRKCWVGPDVGSPHRPLLADLELKVH